MHPTNMDLSKTINQTINEHTMVANATQAGQREQRLMREADAMKRALCIYMQIQ